MAKYRVVKADYYGGRSEKLREYNEDTLTDARKRAIKMIHGDKNDSAYIFDGKAYAENRAFGYVEWIHYDYERNLYEVTGVNGRFYMTPMGRRLKTPIYM